MADELDQNGVRSKSRERQENGNAQTVKRGGPKPETQSSEGGVETDGWRGGGGGCKSTQSSPGQHPSPVPSLHGPILVQLLVQ